MLIPLIFGVFVPLTYKGVEICYYAVKLIEASIIQLMCAVVLWLQNQCDKFTYPIRHDLICRHVINLILIKFKLESPPVVQILSFK